ncbi:MAG: N-acetylneuraminate synthase family protein, partial [Muribaculaceae bacterium]|nr:N-acetylneuraminate synthase family protein [Muribaculaceae bacterium]
ITYLQRNYPQYTIGFSDHTIGIAAPAVAVGMGARIIEKHITIDRHMKGTDQQGSLGPDGVNRMVRDIRVAERWLGRDDLYVDEAVAAARVKLERSLATRRSLPAGHVITEADVHLLSPGDGFRWASRHEVLGRALATDMGADEIIYPKNLK